MYIINGKIKTMAGNDIDCGFIEVKNGKIANIGKMSEFNTGDNSKEIIDAGGGVVIPGFVDAHTHLGLFEDSLGFEGEDGNEDTDPVTPYLDPIDGINPLERSFEETLKSGVTSVLVSPGSSNVICGKITAIKTHGRRIDDMVIKKTVAVKFALGENPKATFHSKNQTPVTRMAIASIMRDTLSQAREYIENIEKAENDPDLDKPEFDAKFEALIPLLKKEVSAHFHAHRADDIFTAIRIAKEFDLNYVIVHGTGASDVADILAKEEAKIICGPFLTDRSKPELSTLTTSLPKILTDNGVFTAISTDHPETPLKFFMMCGVEAVKTGMTEDEVLKCMTINSAKIGGIDDKVGSLEVGKDADIIIFSDNPFDYKSKLTHVIINGENIKL